jgi:uncharacterized protein (DUF362 family)/NAD-dependent dihydropyrimidine dehydrogenase PreA subunit
MNKTVAALECREYIDEQVHSTVRAAIDLLGGIKSFVRPGERILIKPNLLAGKPAEAAVTTHPSVVGAVIRLVKEAGGTPVVGDSPGIGSALKIAEKCGIAEACDREGAELIELKTLVKVENPAGHTFKRLEVAEEALKADGIINVAKLKTHAQMFLTLGVKNLFGCVPGKRKPQWHLSAGVDNGHFAGMLLDLHNLLAPRLTVMDGVVAMEGNGPGSGDPRALGLIFASGSAVAMDAVITEILGARARDVPILRTALEWGIPEADFSEVELLGLGIEDMRVTGFDFPPQLHVNFAAKLPYFIDRRLRKTLTSRPHVDRAACTLCGICVEVCPAEVMTKTDRITINYDSCIRCYCCQEMCPEGAIASREGLVKRLLPGM